MARTKNRPLVQGTITARHALVFATVLCAGGFGLLAWFTNPLTVYTGLLGLYTYLLAYGAAKRRGSFGTIVGSLAGATPILAGYTAVTGQLDATGGLLFLALALWQMPHFYAIALYRLDDYKAAGIPVLPAVRGVSHTKAHIYTYIICFGLCVILLASYGGLGYGFLLANALLTSIWLWKGLVGLNPESDSVWAKRMFRYSLLVLLGFCITAAISPWLP
jgi:protoheme IX farnesyltransferase